MGLLIKYLRISLIITSILIILFGVLGFVYGNIEFNSDDAWFFFSHGFLGGHLVSVSLFIISYGALGFYSTVKKDKNLLVIFTGLVCVQCFSRIFFFTQAACRGEDMRQSLNMTLFHSFLSFELYIILNELSYLHLYTMQKKLIDNYYRVKSCPHCIKKF